MKKLLPVLLVLWMLLVVTGCLGYMALLGKQITGNGPQALSGDGARGFFLVANRQILHFDAQEQLRERHDIGALGLQAASSILHSDGLLLAYDNETHRIFRCTLPAWQCQPFSPASLALSDSVSMTWQTPSTLAVSDNTGHRLLLLDAQGKLVQAGNATWHYPNQITTVADGLMLADTDRNVILHLADITGAKAERLLDTTSRPYQFVRRDASWWVLQAGTRLENGKLYRYRDGIPKFIHVNAQDPTALLDTGNRLIIASRQDWQLLSLNPDSGNIVPAGDSTFQAELRAQHLEQQNARKRRGLLPYAMLALMLPALLGGIALQRRTNAGSSPAVTTPATREFPSADTTRSRAGTRIDTDKGRIEMLRLQQNRNLLKAGLILIPLFALLALLLWLTSMPLPRLLPLLFLMAVLLVLVPALVYAGRRKQDRLFDQHFICGPQKLVHVRQGKPVGATSYADIWLGSETLLLKGKAVPLYVGMGKRRTPFWMVHDIQREVGKRIPPTQFFDSDHDMGKALLGRNPLLGLRLILARYAVAFAIVVVLLLKLMQVLHHFHVDKLWKIFHPD